MGSRGRRILLTLALLPATELWSAFPDFPFGEHELKHRTGYYEAGGKYLGGIPKYDTEFELFECTEFNYDNSHDAPLGNEATVCLGWTSSVVSSADSEAGVCWCDELTAAGYCGKWSCSRLEVSDDDGRASSYTSSVVSESRPFLVESESAGQTGCACEIEHDSGNFCALWACVETRSGITSSSSSSSSGSTRISTTSSKSSTSGSSSTHTSISTSQSNSGSGQRFEEYRCVRESADAEYCDAWTGVTENSNQVTLSACECVDEWNSVAVCSYWECESRVMTRCKNSGPGWCNIGISVGVGGFFGSLGALLATWGLLRLVHREKESYFDSSGYDVFFGLAWMAGWAAGVVIWGGQDGAVYVGIWWGAIVAIGLLCGWHIKTRSRA